MNLKRTSMLTAVILIALLLQFAPSLSTPSVAAATRCNWVSFVADITIPDGSTFYSGRGQGVVKIWRLKNIGSCTWSTAYSLVFAYGSQLSYLSSSALPKEVKPGETIDLSLPFQVPYVAGHYRGYWQLKSADGTLFGMGPKAANPFYVDIIVADLTNAYDFATNACAATWRSDAGLLPCPGTDGDVRGFILKPARYKVENGVDFTAPGLVLFPQNKFNGYIQGTYPEFTVQNGDRFQGTFGCEYGSSCYVTLRLDYQVGSGSLQTFAKWTETNEGRTYSIDQNLSSLAGKKVKFSLTLLATGSATGDRAALAMPFIVRLGGGSGPTPTSTVTTTATATTNEPTSTPTVTATITPTPTASATPIPPILPDVFYDFGSNACAAAWKSGAGALPCPGTDGDSRGFILPVSNPMYENGASDSSPSLILFPQNKYDGYIQGTYPEITIQAGDRFQSIVNCAYGSSCYVTFRLEYQIGNGPQIILWKWSEKNEGQFYRMDQDLSALAGKTVKFTLTLLASGPATGDRALWAQPRLIRTATSSPTPSVTPTATSEPSRVTGVTANVAKPVEAVCGQPNPVDVSGTITTNGPATVVFHWEMRGDKTNTTADETLVFTSAGTQTIFEGAYKVDCGNYSARLVITSPNSFDAITYYSIFSASATSSPTPTTTATATAAPQDSVTNLTASVSVPEIVNCSKSMYIDLLGSITTDGPATVIYHWEVEKPALTSSPETTLVFTSAATQSANLPTYEMDNCGSYTARLVVTSPNPISAQTSFTLSLPTPLPIYDFSNFQVIGTLACGDVLSYAWVAEACNGESGGCMVSQTPLFGKSHAGFLRYEGNSICKLNLP